MGSVRIRPLPGADVYVNDHDADSPGPSCETVLLRRVVMISPRSRHITGRPPSHMDRWDPYGRVITEGDGWLTLLGQQETEARDEWRDGTWACRPIGRRVRGTRRSRARR